MAAADDAVLDLRPVFAQLRAAIGGPAGDAALSVNVGAERLRSATSFLTPSHLASQEDIADMDEVATDLLSHFGAKGPGLDSSALKMMPKKRHLGGKQRSKTHDSKSVASVASWAGSDSVSIPSRRPARSVAPTEAAEESLAVAFQRAMRVLLRKCRRNAGPLLGAGFATAIALVLARRFSPALRPPSNVPTASQSSLSQS
eukprot:TRINITY_DN6711_c0_g1_i1.p1 TRINITY_DN6711_c0_g1~~TRINITY_DN6711_c0_g1_i1.p1  ORF type:complete len:201 (-),score=34.67 TRINITY_DN6711_c0_g1_i1:113-715(-)